MQLMSFGKEERSNTSKHCKFAKNDLNPKTVLRDVVVVRDNDVPQNKWQLTCVSYVSGCQWATSNNEGNERRCYWNEVRLNL